MIGGARVIDLEAPLPDGVERRHYLFRREPDEPIAWRHGEPVEIAGVPLRPVRVTIVAGEPVEFGDPPGPVAKLQPTEIRLEFSNGATVRGPVSAFSIVDHLREPIEFEADPEPPAWRAAIARSLRRAADRLERGGIY